MRLEGSVAVVAGGSSGLGRATVQALVARDAQVAIIDVTEPSDLSDLSDKRVLFCRADVTNTDDVAKAFGAINDTFGHLELCVNCAAVHLPARLVNRRGEPFDLESLRRTLEVNVIGVVDVMHRSAVMMLRNGPNNDGERGVIVNVGSIAAMEGPIGSVSYSGSKGAVMGMTLPLARELGMHGVRVLCIAPGSMETPMIGSIDDVARSELVRDNAFPGRLGRPSEFASLVCTIADNVFLNGTTLRLDAGARMGSSLPTRSTTVQDAKRRDGGRSIGPKSIP